MELTKDQLKERILKDNKTLIAALIALNNCQTPQERSFEKTIERNGKGFRAFDAKMGSGMVNFFQKNGFLTDKQLGFWRKKDRNGKEKICVYLNQLHEIHLQKQKKLRDGGE